MDYNEMIDKIEASKEILSTMPKNNEKNIKIYKEKIEDLQNEFNQYNKEICSKLQRRYNNATKCVVNKEIENLDKRLKTIDYILELLDEKKTSYEKMGLDRAIFKISRYYKDNFENINEQIQVCIESFTKVGIRVSLDDFDYSMYVKDYMKTFFQELEKGNINSDKLKEKFEEIYWKCPDIIVHIELNIRNIYLKRETQIDKYFEKEKVEKLKRLDVTEKEIKKNYLDIKRQLLDLYAVDGKIIQERFLSGKLDPKNFSNDKVLLCINSVLPKEIAEGLDKNEEVQCNITRFLNTLYEYQNYKKFQFLIDDIKTYFEDRDKYKNSYVATRKEIEKLESKLRKENKKLQRKGFFGKKRIEYRQTSEIKELIHLIKDKYKELDVNKFYNKVYTDLNKECTIYDVLNLANSYYIYLTSCIIKNFKNISPEDIEIKVNELNEFLSNPYNTFINHTSITEKGDLLAIIKDRYKLLNFIIEKEDFSDKNISLLISKLEIIQISMNMNRANLKIDDIEQLCEIKKILQLN